MEPARSEAEARARLEQMRRALAEQSPVSARRSPVAGGPVPRPARRRVRWKRYVLLGLVAFGVIEAAPGAYEAMRRAEFTALITASDPPDELPVPVIGVRRARLNDTWGAARSGGRRHEGIDIFAPRGTPVMSTTIGIVTTVGTNELGGRIVGVLGPGRQWHYYAHLDRYASVRPGDLVQPGEVLGYVGNSGNARNTPTHLHYGIYRPARGGAVNPYPLLRGEPGN